MSKSNRFIMVICLLLDLFISTARPVLASIPCVWQADRVELEHYVNGSSRTLRARDSADAVATLKAVDGFNTYRNSNDSFISSTGLTLAIDGQVNRWQSYAVFGLYRYGPAGELIADLTIIVWTHPAMPGRAYWMFIQDMEFGNDHPCRALETSLHYANLVYDQLENYPM